MKYLNQQYLHILEQWKLVAKLAQQLHQILESFNVHVNITSFEMFCNFGSNFPHIFVNSFSFIDCIGYSCFLNVQYYYSWPW